MHTVFWEERISGAESGWLPLVESRPDELLMKWTLVHQVAQHSRHSLPPSRYLEVHSSSLPAGVFWLSYTHTHPSPLCTYIPYIRLHKSSPKFGFICTLFDDIFFFFSPTIAEALWIDVLFFLFSTHICTIVKCSLFWMPYLLCMYVCTLTYLATKTHSRIVSYIVFFFFLMKMFSSRNSKI